MSFLKAKITAFLNKLHPKTFRKSNILALSKKEFYSSTWLFWKRIFIMTLQGFKRNKVLSIATIVVLSLIVLVFNVTFAVNYISNQSIKQISQKLDLIVWIKDDAGDFEITALKNDLNNLPKIKEIVFTSKQEALETFQSDNPEVYAFIKQYKLDNPLPASIGIITHKIDDNLEVLDFLKNERYVNTINQDEIKNNIEERRRTEKLINITNFIYQTGRYLVGLFFLVFIFITFNTVNMIINRRAKEISIMRLVGAKHSFIRLPFVLEGIIYAICAFILGLLLMYTFAQHFIQKISETLFDDTLISGFHYAGHLFIQHFNSILFYEILIAIAVGISSSYVAIEWYLRKQNLLED